MKRFRLALVMTILSLLVILTLSFSVFGAANSADAVSPTNGVYEISTKAQLIWVFEAMEDGSVASASASIKLTNDIDVAGELPTLTKIFSGTFNGNGKTISGLSRTMFQQFSGTASNLTLRGTMNKPYSDNESARKTASFALNASDATLTNVVSYVDITTSAEDTNAGGIVGYCNAVEFKNCAYYGTYTLAWNGKNSGLGGIVGWTNPNGGTATFDGCYFGGTITITGTKSAKLYVGGIVGNCANRNVVIKNCTSNGTITSNGYTGGDYIGGIVGASHNEANIIERCSNKGTVSAKDNAGGIIGGAAANTIIDSCANYGTVTAKKVGEICGKVDSGVTVTINNSFSFAKPEDEDEDENDLCPATYVSNGSYRSSEISYITDFTIDGVVYEKYNLCVIEKASGMPMPILSTDKMFEGYLSMRYDSTTHAVRFVVLANLSTLPESATATFAFRDEYGTVIKTYSGKLTLGEDSDFELYASVSAAGENYFATYGNGLFGCVVKNIPNGAWSSIEMTVKDTQTGVAYMTPCSYLHRETMTLESLPSYSSLGTVSNVYNCGPGLSPEDKNGNTEEDSKMVIISSTTADKFASYITTLSNSNYRLVSQNTVDGDPYYTFTKAGAMLYLYYNNKVKEIRIIADNSSTLLPDFNYDYTKKAGDTTEFYQYSINYRDVTKEGYDPVTTPYLEGEGLDCGMLYVLKLPDNKIVMIDGGHSCQLPAKAREALLKFLRQITGKSETEKVDIAMWYFTHAHGDHVAAARDFFTTYRDQVNLERVAFNFPSYQVLSDNYDDNTFTMKQRILDYHPNALYHKLHTGEVVSLAGVTFEVVYTHEDAVSSTSGLLTSSGKTEISSFNDSSTVLKITFDGKTIMMLGDVDSVGQKVIKAFHNSSYLKSDIVQTAHHGYNNVQDLYSYIQAPIALFPNSMYGVKGNNATNYNRIMKYSTYEYFAHKYIYKFEVKNGQFESTTILRYDQQ